MNTQLKAMLDSKQVTEAMAETRTLAMEAGWRAAFAELIVAASEEVNWKNLHAPIGLSVMSVYAQAFETSADPLPLLDACVRFVCSLDRISPGPWKLIGASTRENDWDLTKLTVELLRVVRKSNYLKVFTILASIEDEEKMFRALYAVASNVPGPRGYNLILVQTLEALYPYLSGEQKRQVLLSVTEMFNNLVQSSRYTTTLLYLVGLNQLNEFIPKEPAAPYGDDLGEWFARATANELYGELDRGTHTDEEIAYALRQALLLAPGANGSNVLQVMAAHTAFETCRESFYFNKRYLRCALTRDLTSKQGRNGAPLPNPSHENAQAFMSMPLVIMMSLPDDDFMQIAIEVAQLGAEEREELLHKWLEAGCLCENIDLRIAVLHGYLEAARLSEGLVQAKFVFRALQVLRDIHPQTAAMDFDSIAMPLV